MRGKTSEVKEECECMCLCVEGGMKGGRQTPWAAVVGREDRCVSICLVAAQKLTAVRPGVGQQSLSGRSGRVPASASNGSLEATESRIYGGHV